MKNFVFSNEYYSLEVKLLLIAIFKLKEVYNVDFL